MASTGTVTNMIENESANHARSVSARTSSVVRELDLPDEIGDGRGGKDDRPDTPCVPGHSGLVASTSSVKSSYATFDAATAVGAPGPSYGGLTSTTS